MVVPKYDEFYKEFLEFCSDKKQHKIRDVTEGLAVELKLTKKERAETLNSGGNLFHSRVNWSKTYLKKAGLIESKKRGYVSITKEGLKVLKENPPYIDNEYLMRYDSFLEFLSPSFQRSDKPNKIQKRTEKTVGTFEKLSPLERLESAYDEINKDLADTLLETIKKNPPEFFEKLVVDLLLKMGYGGSRVDAGRAVGQVGDGGIDGIINQDRLGLEKIYIQAKRYNKGTVGRPTVQSFVGALQGEGANKGVFITTSRFSQEAEEYVESNLGSSVILIDGERLADLMIEFGVGVFTKDVYKIKQLDTDYFDD